MTVFGRFLRDRRRASGWWALGVIGLVVFTVAFWPAVRGSTEFDEIVRELPEPVRAMFGIDVAVSIGSAPGYLHGRVFATLLPLLLLIHGIGNGARAIAGDEDDGSLALLLAGPIARSRVAGERLAAVVLLGTALAATAGVAVVALGAPVGLLDGVNLVYLGAAVGGAWALALLHSVLAFAVGAFTGRRTVAVATAGGVAVGGYLLQGLLSAAGSATAVRNLVPWHWYLDRNVLVQGPAAKSVVLPLAVAAVATAIGVARFVRRDLH